MGIGIGKALGSVEDWESGLIYERGYAQPALSHRILVWGRTVIQPGEAYQDEVVGNPPITLTSFGEHRYRYDGGNEDEQSLKAMDAILCPLVVASKRCH